MFRLSHTTSVDDTPEYDEEPEGNAAWLHRHGEHLNRIYPPVAELPAELEALISAIVKRAGR